MDFGNWHRDTSAASVIELEQNKSKTGWAGGTFPDLSSFDALVGIVNGPGIFMFAGQRKIKSFPNAGQIRYDLEAGFFVPASKCHNFF